MNIKAFFKTKNMKDLIITIVSQMLIMIVAFITNKFISNSLGPSGYSIYSLVKKSSGVVSGIMAFSLGIALPRYCSLNRDNNNKVMRFVVATLYLFFTIVLITSLVLLIGKDAFAGVIFDDIRYVYLMLPMICYSFSIAITTLLFSYYRGTNRFYWYNISQMLYNLLMLLLCLFFGNNLELMLIMWGISCSIFGFGFFGYEIVKLFRKTNKKVFNTFKECKELFIYSAPRLVGEFALFGFTSIPLIQIAHMFGAENVYMISTPLNFCGMIFPIFSFSGIILLPMVSEEVAKKNISKSSSFINKMALLYLFLAIIGSLLVILLAKYLIIIFFSEDYVDTITVLKIMIFSIVPGAIYYLYRNPLDAVSRFPLNSINLAISLLILCTMISFAKDYNFISIAFDVAYLVLGVLSYSMWIIFRNRFNKKNRMDAINEEDNSSPNESTEEVLEKNEIIEIKEESKNVLVEEEIKMPKKDKGINLKDIVKMLIKRKIIFGIVFVITFIICFLGLHLIYNDNNADYVYQYKLQMDTIETSADSELITFADGSSYNYKDLVKEKLLTKILANVEIDEELKEKLISDELITISKSSDGTYTLKTPKKNFLASKDARLVLTEIAEYPIKYTRNYYQNFDYSKYINKARECSLYEDELDLLIKQEKMIGDGYEAILAGNALNINVEELKLKIDSFNDYLLNNSSSSLLYRIRTNGFIKNDSNLLLIEKQKEALEEELYIANNTLTNLYGVLDNVKVLGKESDDTIKAVLKDIYETTKSKNSLEVKLEAYEKYLDQSSVDLTKKATLENDLENYYSKISSFTNEYKSVIIELKNQETRLSNVKNSTTDLSVVVEVLISFLISLILATTICIVLEVKKTQEEKFKKENQEESQEVEVKTE